jgi:transcriptional regulator with XRE-family HTH domain
MADNKNNKIGEELKKFFKAKHITQQNIATELGISQAAVAALFNGKSFGKKTAKIWADKFGLQSSWLLTGEGTMLKKESGNVSQSVNAGKNAKSIKQVANAPAEELLEIIRKKDEQIDKLLEIIQQSKKY